MDTRSEDTIVRQIEKNLTNNMSDNLFVTGRVIESNRLIPRNKGELVRSIDDNEYRRPEVNKDVVNNIEEYPLVSNDYISNSPSISRAEYIRQAREACLRQLSNTQLYSRPYDVNYMEPDIPNEQLTYKKSKVMKLFHNNSEEDARPEKSTEQQLASYRSIVIRSICAIVLFLSVFALDKFNVNIGEMTNQTIKEYVTGNDALQDLENIIVTWLK